MIAPNQPIEIADLQALATLANAKLTPGTPYAFQPFAGDDQIALPDPKSLKFQATYGGTGQFIDGQKITVRLYAYKTIAGAKTFNWNPLLKAFTGTAGAGNFSLKFSWTPDTSPAAPDGYLVSVPQTQFPFQNDWVFAWLDLGAMNQVIIDGSFNAWHFDGSYIAGWNNPGDDLPCGHGIWEKTLNQIRSDAFNKLSLFGGATSFGDVHKVSGPWCISQAPKCYLQFNNQPVHKNLQFLYSPADSAAGNELSPEADMFGVLIAAGNGANSFNWGVNVLINGAITFHTDNNPGGFILSTSDPSITAVDSTGGPNGDLVFTFNNTKYTVGTPIVLTATRTGVRGVTTGQVDAVFTGDKQTLAQVDATAIHYSGSAAKSVALDESPPDITMTTGLGGNNPNPVHWLAYCNGVFIANTLPTQGIMPNVDVDLPQYNPQPTPNLGPPSSQRAPRGAGALPYMPVVDNKGSLWPVLPVEDFTPDSVQGKAFKGSKAWNLLGTKYVFPFIASAPMIPATIPPEQFLAGNGAIAITDGTGATQQVRILETNASLQAVIKFGSLPANINDGFQLPNAGAWNILTPATPGWADGVQIYIGFFNPTADPQSTSTLYAVTDNSPAAPDGTFFPTLNNPGDPAVPQIAGQSYNFDVLSPGNDLRPIPLYGYCIFAITARHLPGSDGLAPSTGTEDLDVDIGLMPGFGFDAAGAFQKIQTITIPAGQASVTVPVFWPVLGGAPLAYSCDEVVSIRAQVNFQPMMHSSYQLSTNANQQPLGYYDGPPYQNNFEGSIWYGLFFPDGDFVNALGVMLPIAAAFCNDIEALLNAF